MPPTRWRGGSGLPRRSNSTGGRFADFTSRFVAGAFDPAELVTLGFFVFIGLRPCRLHFKVCRRTFA
jgi:hypothetical protein